METHQTLSALFEALPGLRSVHAPGTPAYHFLKLAAKDQTSTLFSDAGETAHEFGPFADLIFPYVSMGAVDSVNLFDLDELIMFSFYWINRGRYKRVLDIGANLGLHSIIMSKCGFKVRAYEPDPVHYELLLRNLKLNKADNVKAVNKAISNEAGELEFVRVLGNTTSSHLAGSKANPYGELERVPVKVEAIRAILDWADLIKMDAEGHEKEILLATKAEDWKETDAFVEIESETNAAGVFEHLNTLDVNIFAQKLNWQKVNNISEMPTSYHDGMLFLSAKSEMPW